MSSSWPYFRPPDAIFGLFFVCLFSSWLLNWNCHTENKLEFQQLRKYNDYYTVQGAHEPRRATHVFMSHVTAFSGLSLFLRSILSRECWLSAYARNVGKTSLSWLLLLHVLSLSALSSFSLCNNYCYYFWGFVELTVWWPMIFFYLDQFMSLLDGAPFATLKIVEWQLNKGEHWIFFRVKSLARRYIRDTETWFRVSTDGPLSVAGGMEIPRQ